jgi:hypothetical protein
MINFSCCSTRQPVKSNRSFSSGIADYCLWTARGSLWRAVSCSVPIGITSIPPHVCHQSSRRTLHHSRDWDQSEKSGNDHTHRDDGISLHPASWISHKEARYGSDTCWNDLIWWLHVDWGGDHRSASIACVITITQRKPRVISEKFIMEAPTWLHVRTCNQETTSKQVEELTMVCAWYRVSSMPRHQSPCTTTPTWWWRWFWLLGLQQS